MKPEGRPVAFKRFGAGWLFGHFQAWGAGSVHPVAIVEMWNGEVATSLNLYRQNMYFLDTSRGGFHKFLWWITPGRSREETT